ncbi:AMP-binding protein [Yinghuangia aomiensis]
MAAQRPPRGSPRGARRTAGRPGRRPRAQHARPAGSALRRPRSRARSWSRSTPGWRPRRSAYILGHERRRHGRRRRRIPRPPRRRAARRSEPAAHRRRVRRQRRRVRSPAGRRRPSRCPSPTKSLLSLSYTSGTTRRPKGVMYHHRGAYLQALAMAYQAKLDTSSRYLWTLPMFHTNGWCFLWAVTAAGGVHHCLRKVDAAAIWRAIREDGVTHFCAAPTVLAMLAADPAAALPAEREHRVQAFASGAPPAPALLAELGAAGVEIHHLYGLTETFGPAVVCAPQPEWRGLPAERRAALTARQGIANIVAEPVRVVDESGTDVPADGATLGEIVLRGNNVMLGYYRDPEATAPPAPPAAGSAPATSASCTPTATSNSATAPKT